jgi:copper resistance protein C
MKIRVLTIVLLVLITCHLPLPVFAHSELESASPADGEKVTTDLEAIVLIFSTKIESFSSITLTKEENQIPLQMSIEDNQITGKITKQLKDGEYKVGYRIIGRDGHVIEGNYGFTVDRPKLAQSEEKKENVNENGNVENLPVPKKNEQPQNPGYFAPLTIVLFIATAIISYFIFRRKS